MIAMEEENAMLQNEMDQMKANKKRIFELKVEIEQIDVEMLQIAERDAQFEEKQTLLIHEISELELNFETLEKEKKTNVDEKVDEDEGEDLSTLFKNPNDFPQLMDFLRKAHNTQKAHSPKPKPKPKQLPKLMPRSMLKLRTPERNRPGPSSGIPRLESPRKRKSTHLSQPTPPPKKDETPKKSRLRRTNSVPYLIHPDDEIKAGTRKSPRLNSNSDDGTQLISATQLMNEKYNQKQQYGSKRYRKGPPLITDISKKSLQQLFSAPILLHNNTETPAAPIQQEKQVVVTSESVTSVVQQEPSPLPVASVVQKKPSPLAVASVTITETTPVNVIAPEPATETAPDSADTEMVILS